MLQVKVEAVYCLKFFSDSPLFALIFNLLVKKPHQKYDLSMFFSYLHTHKHTYTLSTVLSADIICFQLVQTCFPSTQDVPLLYQILIFFFDAFKSSQMIVFLPMKKDIPAQGCHLYPDIYIQEIMFMTALGESQFTFQPLYKNTIFTIKNCPNLTKNYMVTLDTV